MSGISKTLMRRLETAASKWRSVTLGTDQVNSVLVTIDKISADRDRAIAAFHAAIRKPMGVVPAKYDDLYDHDHEELDDGM